MTILYFTGYNLYYTAGAWPNKESRSRVFPSVSCVYGELQAKIIATNLCGKMEINDSGISDNDGYCLTYTYPNLKHYI